MFELAFPRKESGNWFVNFMNNLLKYFCIFMCACVMLYSIGAIFVPLMIVGALALLAAVVFGFIDGVTKKDP